MSTFKPYNQDQMFLLPPSLEEIIASNQPLRISVEGVMEIQPGSGKIRKP